MRETLAAALIMASGWDHRAPLLDPFCGSGTIPIEAALIAANIAPGRLRSQYGFIGWRGHDTVLWKRLLDEARAGEIRDRKHLPRITGYDADARVVKAALANAENAGLRGVVHFEKRSLEQCEAPDGLDGETRGLFVVNPPYTLAAQLRALLPWLAEVLGRFDGAGWQLDGPAARLPA